MEFVTPLMLVGLTGIAIPILIHLFNRRSAKVVDWGAFRFLRDCLMKRRRRLLLEETLLLVCRCLLIACLACALARPFIKAQSSIPWMLVLPLVFLAVIALGAGIALSEFRKWHRGLLIATGVFVILIATAILTERSLGLLHFGRTAARDVAIIVDCSASMAMTREGSSNLDQIRKEIEADIRRANRGVAFGVIQGGSVPRRLTPAPILDRRALYELLPSLSTTSGSLDVPAALTAATALLAEGHNPTKQIIIYGDSQATGWNCENEPKWEVVKTLFEQLPSPPQILWRALERPDSLRNLAVEDIKPVSDLVGTDRETTIQVTLRNTGKEAVTPQQVSLKIHHPAKTLTQSRVGQILPNATQVVEFRHRFSRPGLATLTAEVTAQDDIAVDDSAQRVFHVIGTLKVLLVETSPSARFSKQSTGFLQVALRPEVQQLSAEGGLITKPADFLVEPKVESAAAFARRDSFQDCAVVVLANVPQLPSETAEKLATFVANGGGLLITPGAKINPDFYNGWSWQGQPVLPLPLRSFQSQRRSRLRPSLDPESFSGHALRNLKAQNDLKRAIIAGWWNLDASQHPERVEGLMSSQNPFLASHAIGRGLVLLSAFPLDATLSNLPSLNSFLPLVHEIAYTLANPTQSNLNIDPAPSPVVLISPGGYLADSSSVAATNLSEKATLHTVLATGTQNAIVSYPTEWLQSPEGLALQIKAHLEPGLYSAEVPVRFAALLSPLTQGTNAIPLLVKTQVAESDLSPMPEASLEWLRHFVNLEVAKDPDAITAALQGKRFGQEIWRPLATAAFCLLLLELLLARWIAVQRRTGQEETIAFEPGSSAPDSFQEQLNHLRNRSQNPEVMS